MKHTLNYITTYPNTQFICKISNIVLKSPPDASYLYAPKAKSCGAAYIFLGSKSLCNSTI